MPPIVRFAPSPTGFLQVTGGAHGVLRLNLAVCQGASRRHVFCCVHRGHRPRTGLDARVLVQTILEGLQWLGLKWDAEPVCNGLGASRAMLR